MLRFGNILHSVETHDVTDLRMGFQANWREYDDLGNFLSMAVVMSCQADVAVET